MIDEAPPEPSDDPVLIRRAHIAAASSAGKRVGYLLFLTAIVVFLIGFFGRFESWVATVIGICLLIGSILLIPSIVLGYAVKAADREDRGLSSGH